MQVTIDARGLSCPLPRMRTLDAIRNLEQGVIVVLTDEAASCDSIIRTTKALGLPYQVEREDEDFKLTIRKEELWVTKLEPKPGTS